MRAPLALKASDRDARGKLSQRAALLGEASRVVTRNPANTAQYTTVIAAQLTKLGISASEACHRAGLSRDAIRNIQRGSIPSATTWARLVLVLELYPGDPFGPHQKVAQSLLAIDKRLRALEARVSRIEDDQAQFVTEAGRTGTAESPAVAEAITRITRLEGRAHQLEQRRLPSAADA